MFHVCENNALLFSSRSLSGHGQVIICSLSLGKPHASARVKGVLDEKGLFWLLLAVLPCAGAFPSGIIPVHGSRRWTGMLSFGGHETACIVPL